MKVRQAVPDDFEALGQVMFEAVRGGPSAYSETQREAWTPEPNKGAEWTARMAPQFILLGEDGADVMGFMSLTDEGYLDCAFIRPNARGSGLFRELFEGIETQARAKGLTRIWAHVSLTAQPAAEALGMSKVEDEDVELRGEVFRRAVMEKRLES
ncbi:MAG: GNAT family N-acetyltransferase [Hyphomonadaceae bacterium]|nr:GNAT family N-acetyltransferase [Hyphomonadaceae bacterium]